MNFVESSKKYFNNILNVASLLISLIGALLTIYFAVFYIPDYIKQAYNERVSAANKELVQFLKESSYNNKTLTLEILKSQVVGKEIKYKIKYPYSISELVIQTEESFTNDYFIPLDTRTSLITNLEKLKDTASSIKPPVDGQNKRTDIISLATSLLGVLLSTLGIVGAFSKLKKEKPVPSEQGIEEIKESIESEVKSGLDFEEIVKDAITSIHLKYDRSMHNRYMLDFLISYKGKSIGIECKYSKKGILASPVIYQLEAALSTSQMDIILITNGEITRQARKVVNSINSKHKHSIQLLRGTTTEDIANGLDQLLKELDGKMQDIATI